MCIRDRGKWKLDWRSWGSTRRGNVRAGRRGKRQEASGSSYGRLSAPPALYGLFKVWHNILLNHLVNESAATVTPAVILGQNQIFPN